MVDILSVKKIYICCLQETDIPNGFPENILNCGGYNIELEMNSEKKRVGIYVSTAVNYTRRSDLDQENVLVVIIDVKSDIQLRIN